MKYCVINVDDRASQNIEHINSLLIGLEYVKDIEYFDARLKDPWFIIDDMGIRQDVWNPYDGRTSSPLPGELGIWISTINSLNYIINNNIDKMLILEDDAILDSNFVNNFNLCLEELPEDFDFFALTHPKEQNFLTEKSNIGLKNIHKSINQYSNAVGMFYSLKGAKKIIKLVKRYGIEYTSDCFIFNQSHKNNLIGYSIIPDQLSLISHKASTIKSIIDPNNIRETDNG